LLSLVAERPWFGTVSLLSLAALCLRTGLLRSPTGLLLRRVMVLVVVRSVAVGCQWVTVGCCGAVLFGVVGVLSVVVVQSCSGIGCDGWLPMFAGIASRRPSRKAKVLDLWPQGAVS
jgi:hypothetical protein